MAVIETWLRQDLKAMVNVRSLQGQVFSLDNGGNLIGVKVTRDGEPVALEGTIAGYCILPDGETINITPASGNTGIQNGNEAYVILPQLAYSVPGQISIVIKLAQGSSVTTLAACTGYVYKSRTSNEVVPPGTPIPDLHTLETVIANAVAATASANTAAAAAENVDASMSKSGDVITITVTNRDGVTTTETLSDQSEAVEELQNAIVTKAEQNGYYPDMTVGTAEQLVSDEGVTDTELYLYRKSGGSVEVGNREKLEKIVGGTIAWNQLIENGNFANNSGWNYNTQLTVANNEATIMASSTNPAFNIYRSVPFINNHKILVTFFAKGTAQYARVRYPFQSQDASVSNNYSQYGFIKGISEDGENLIDRIMIQGIDYSHDSEHVLVIKNINCFDLTQMFGSTIADYIYNLEQANAGDGVAWFKKLFPKDYYPYNAGELISVSGLSEHKMVGFNLWDEEWEVGGYDVTAQPTASTNEMRGKNFIPVIPNTQYCFTTPIWGVVYQFDFDKNLLLRTPLIGGDCQPLFTTLTNTSYIKFYLNAGYGTIYKNDVCINLSDPSRNGEYEPYEKNSYPLDSSLTLRGIPKLDANNKLYYDGDEYTPDGMVKRKYGIVDLGTLTWNYTETPSPYNAKRYFSSTMSSRIKSSNNRAKGNAICTKYVTGTANEGYVGTKKDSITIDTNGAISVYPITEYADAATFKAAMSGVMLVYELATPTTEQASPYNPIQVVDPYGTEEFVSTSIVPVGHSTKYLEDHVKKLEDTVRKLNDNVITESVGPAPIVSIKDGADWMPLRSLSVAVEPVQDLHGYDHPWPGGSEKNKYNADALTPLSQNSITATVSNGEITLNGTATASAYFSVPCSISVLNSVTMHAGNPVANTAVHFAYRRPNGSYFGDNHLSIANYLVTVNGQNEIDNILFYVEAGTTLSNFKIKPLLLIDDTTTTEWTPYSNICPITGWASAKVTRTGKNLLNPTLASGTNAGLTATKQSDNSYKVTGTANAIAVNIWIKGQYITDAATQLDTFKIMFLKAGTIVTFKDCKLFFYDIETCKANQTFGINQVLFGSAAATLTIPRDSWLTGVRIPDAVNGETYDMTVYPQIELGSTATAYEPYQGQTYEVSFPSQAGTVYGGTLAIYQDGSGELVVKKKYTLIKNNTWVYEGNHFMTATSDGNVVTLNDATEVIRAICSAYKSMNQRNGSVANGSIYPQSPFPKRILIGDERYTDVASFVSAMGEEQIVYELAAPVTYQFTPQEITTLLGTNNIWADTGDTTITYPADTKMYIDNKITQAIAAALNA